MLFSEQKSLGSVRANASTKLIICQKSSCWSSSVVNSITSALFQFVRSMVTTSSGLKWPIQKLASVSLLASFVKDTELKLPFIVSASPSNDRFVFIRLQHVVKDAVKFNL